MYHITLTVYLAHAQGYVSFSATFDFSVQCYCKSQYSNCVPYVQEELWKKLRKAIKENDEKLFHCHLSGLDELLQDDNRMKELVDGSLAYAAYTGFQTVLETLIQKGGGKKYS